MKKIKVFLASSITDLELDRKAVGDFFTQLNNIYIDRGIYFQLVKCDTYDDAIVVGGKQAQYDQEIRDSELCFVLFFKKVGDYTKHEFEVALDAYKNCKKPKIVVYFKYVENGEEATAEVNAFMKTLDTELRHYYNSYQCIDTLKLGMLMQIKLMGLDAEEPVVENGKVMFGGDVIADAQNIPMFAGNKSLSTLKSRLAQITPKYFELQAEFVKDPNNMNINREYSALATEKAEIEKQIKEIEKAVLETTKTMLEKTAKGDLSPRQVAAYRALEKGDYDAALEVLDLSAIMADLTHNEQMSDGYIERVQTNVNELLSRVEVLKKTGVTQSSAEEIEKLYQTAYDRIEKFNLDKEPLYDYAMFLYSQKNYLHALEIAKQLQYHYSDPSAEIEEYKIGKLNNLAGVLYLYTNQFDLAEGSLKKAMGILIKLAEENPDAFEPDLAKSYGNLGILYYQTKRFNFADDTYKKALDIFSKLAQKSPDAFEPNVAVVYYSLGNMYYNTERFDRAEGAYKKALNFRIKLAQKNPDAFEPDLAMCYNNLGNLYSDTGQLDFAEDAYKNALKIRIKLAQKNPDTFEPDLADIYYDMGIFYGDTGRFDLAESALKKASDIYIKLAHKNPDAFEPDLADSYYHLSLLYSGTERFNLAEDVCKKSLNIYIKLAKKNPDAFEPGLADSYSSLGLLYKGTKRFDLAEDAYKNALKIRIKLAQKNPDAFEPDLAGSYSNLGLFYSVTGRFVLAEDACKKALDIYIKLAKKNPDAFEPDLASIYLNFGLLYSDTKRRHLEKKANKKAYAIAKKHPEDSTCAQIISLLENNDNN